MVTTHILGFPRIGVRRELKFALESFWRTEADAAYLQGVGRQLREAHWAAQAEAKLAYVSVGDFSFYDHMLDMALSLGGAPARFGEISPVGNLGDYFALARGRQDRHALEMTKWFDTNYHYLVPELQAGQVFRADASRLLAHIAEARKAGHAVKPVMVGPLTFLWLSKIHQAGANRLELMPALARAYADLLAALADAGVEWVQIDEPALGMDLDAPWLDAFAAAYRALPAKRPKLLLTTYFAAVDEHADRIVGLPLDGIHLDLVRAPQQLDRWLAKLPAGWVLSAGVIDGRNIWRSDLDKVLALLKPLHRQLGERLWIAPSCSLLHVPGSLETEQKMDGELRSWLAFAKEKLEELRILASALDAGEATVDEALAASRDALTLRRSSRRIHNEIVQRRLKQQDAALTRRGGDFESRIARQRAHLQLPLLPTTTIGSFPQTAQIRAARAAYKRREISELSYLEAMRAEIALAVERQEALGLDVLVHGEAERNDMVEYFGERLWGYAFTDNGWVQSYGSRCVKPPIIYGDVYRPEPMTVETSKYAQSLTARPMKGMLTGPVTMLQWSFVRDDQPRATTAMQLAWAIRDEVDDLQKAGIRVIQIDEPAFREGLPINKRDWAAYLEWAVQAFKLAACVADDETQIHTHMCYSEFNDILPAIAAMDADVITIETSRSNMELLDGFATFDYPNEIGPGVYDIHSPRVPDVAEMTRLLERACKVIAVERLWVNPDCGLKTRGWPETETALRNMVAATHQLRSEFAAMEPLRRA